MKSCSLLVVVASLICSFSAEARFDSSPFQNIPKSTRSSSDPSSTMRRPSNDDRRSAPASQADETRTSPKYDRRVKNALDEESMKYRINEKGNFILTLSWETDDAERSQVVFISSRTETLCDHEIREIWSVGLKNTHLARAELANVLALNESYKIGAWGIVRSDDGDESLVFTAKVPASIPASVLVGIAQVAAKTADTFELKHSGKDDL